MRITIAVVIFALLIGSVVFYDTIRAPFMGDRLSVEFSERQYFHTEDFTVQLTPTLRNARVYYTLDGSTPTLDSAEYRRPLAFSVQDDLQIVTIKALAVFNNRVFSNTSTRTYFLGSDVHERFDTMIISLSTDAENLYDHDTGIMVAGATRDEFLRENPDHEPQPNDPANFNMRGAEWERPVFMEAILPTGERVFSQGAGMRIHGAYAREDEPSALRIIPRREYNPRSGTFDYNFFNDVSRDGIYTQIARYETIVLRNGAEDRNHGMLRNEAGLTLARQAGLTTVLPHRPVVVFLNGEYYGFAWLVARAVDHFLEDLYGAPMRSFDNVSGGEYVFETEEPLQLEALNELVGFAEKDLTNDAVFAQLEAILDIDDFLRYYGFQMYIGAEEWPFTNLRRWRYTGGAGLRELAPELDGRWRHFVADLDLALGLAGDYTTPTFERVLTDSELGSPLLASLLKRPDMAERFTIIINDLAANAVTENSTREAIGALTAAAQREITTAINAGRFQDGVTWQTMQENHADMVEFAQKRPLTVFPFLAEYFGFDNSLFNVSVTGGEAVIGSLPAASSRYFEHLTVPVSPVLPQFGVFEHWTLNGRQIDTPDITVTSQDAVDGTAQLALTISYDYPPVMIEAAYETPEGASVIVLRNTTDEPVVVDSLYFSNQADNLRRYRIPRIRIEANSTEEFAGMNSQDADDIWRTRINFNVRKGRMIFLSDMEGNVVQTIIPE